MSGDRGMTQELIERLIEWLKATAELAQTPGVDPAAFMEIVGKGAAGLLTEVQSQSARIAELRDGLEDAASCLKEAGHTISRLEHGKIGERNFAYVAAEHAASLTKDSTSG